MTSELTSELEQALVQHALQVRQLAYAPYSKFLVGSALLGSDGQIYVGCNVENASYGLAICAERSAIAAMVAAGCKDIVALAVASHGGAAPCGACRQVIYELGKSAPILLANANFESNGESPQIDMKRVQRHVMSDLLPMAFGPDDL
ncbi:MAG: cytidine deaminase [Pirellulaceae bacterium]